MKVSFVICFIPFITSFSGFFQSIYILSSQLYASLCEENDYLYFKRNVE